MNLFKKPSVISLLVITLISYSVVKQVHTAHVNIEVIEESDDPDSSLPKSESLTSLDSNNNSNNHNYDNNSTTSTLANISAVNKSIIDDGAPHIIGATASTISPNDTMLADESIASPISFTLADVTSDSEEGKRHSDLLIDSAAKSAIAQLQYEASQSKGVAYSSFGFPLDAASSEQQIHVLPNGDYVYDSPLANIPAVSSPAVSASQVTPVSASAPSSGGSNSFFSSLFSKSTPSSPSAVGGGVNSFITSGSASAAGASDEESRLKSFLTSTATRFPFSGFLRGSKDIKQGQLNENIVASQSERQQQQQLQQQQQSVHESIVADASNISPTSTNGNPDAISIEQALNGASEAAASETAAAAAAAAVTGAGSNIAVVHQTQFDPVQVELGLSAYPPGESVSPSDLITTAAQVNLPQGDSVSITSAGATSLGQQSFTGQATSSSSQLNHHHHHQLLAHANSQQVQQQSNSYNGFFGKYRNRLPRIRINPFKNVWKNADKSKEANAPVVGNIETPVNNVNTAQQSPSPLGPGPLTYFKNSEPLLSSKFTPKLPSMFLLPIKLFSTATKPLNMLIGRGKKGKGKSISLFNKRPAPSNIVPTSNQPIQHVLPLVNTEQGQSSFVLVGDNGKLINDATVQQGASSIYMFVPKNQPIESAHHLNHASPASASSAPGSFANAHTTLSSGFISNLPTEYVKDSNNSSSFTDAASVDSKDAIIIEDASARARIPFKSHLHFIEGQEQDEVNFSKDQETLIASEPEAQASDGSKVHHLPQASEPQQHVYIPSDLHDKIQQIQSSLPQNVKEQLHAFAGKVIANSNPSGNKNPTIPPALAAIAAQLSPDQIKSLAGVFLNVQHNQQQHQEQPPQAPIQPSLAAFTLPETPFSLGSYQQKAPLIHTPQAQQQQQHQQQQPAQPAAGSLRHRFHFRNPFKSVSSHSGHQEESRNVPFLFFGDGGAGRGVSSFFRRPRLIPTSSHLHGESEIPASHSESNAPQIQFIPLDGRPNGSPHMDQIEHMLSAALRPDAHTGESNEANNQPIIHLNGQHENAASGHYTVVPVGVPIASAHPSLMQAVPEGSFLPALPINHDAHGATLLFDQNGSPLVRRPALADRNLRHHQAGQRRPAIGLPKLVSPPELGSAYSNGWIPKDLPQDWSPGPIRTPSPAGSSEYDAFTKFTAADSITPRPPVASSSVSRFTPPGQALRPVSVTTPQPTVVSSTEKPLEAVDEIHVEEARHEDNLSKQLPKDKKKEFKQQETPRKKNATDSIKLTGKQQLIKLWLSQTQTPQDAVETTTSTVSTSTAAASAQSSGRQGKSLKDSIKPSVTVSVSASLNPTVKVDRAHSPNVVKSTSTTTTTTSTTTASSVIVPVTESSSVAPAAAPAALSSTSAPVASTATTTSAHTAGVTSTTTSVPSTVAATVDITVPSEVPFRPSVPRYTAERIIKSTTTAPIVSTVSNNENVAKMEPISKVAKEGVIESLDIKDGKEVAKINDKDDLAKIWSPSGKSSDQDTPSSSTSPEPVYLNH